MSSFPPVGQCLTFLGAVWWLSFFWEAAYYSLGSGEMRIVLDFDLVCDFIGMIVSLCSVKLVEQELWQKEEKGLIGVLPVRDSEAGAVGSLLSAGEIDCCFKIRYGKLAVIVDMYLLTEFIIITLAGVGSDSGEGGSKAGGSAEESSKQDTKNGKAPIHWHSKWVTSASLLI